MQAVYCLFHIEQGAGSNSFILLAIMKTLDPNKVHGSIKMIKICRQSLILPLKTIF